MEIDAGRVNKERSAVSRKKEQRLRRYDHIRPKPAPPPPPPVTTVPPPVHIQFSQLNVHSPPFPTPVQFTSQPTSNTSSGIFPFPSLPFTPTISPFSTVELRQRLPVEQQRRRCIDRNRLHFAVSSGFLSSSSLSVCGEGRRLRSVGNRTLLSVPSR